MARLIKLTLNEDVGSTTFANAGTVAGNFTSTGSISVVSPGVLSGNAVDFVNQASVRYLAGASAFDSVEPSSFTVWCWVKHNGTTPSNYSHILHKAATAGTGWSFPYTCIQISFPLGSLVPHFDVNNSSPYVGLQLDGPSALSANVWHMLAMSYNGTTLKAYVDGALVATATGGIPINYASHGHWQIGGSYSGTPETFVGVIDDVNLEDSVFSDAQVLAEYNAVRFPNSQLSTSDRLGVDSNVIGYWGFDEAVETDAAMDGSSNTLHLTVSGSTGTAPGRVGNARKFDGSATFASVASSLLRLTGDLTLIAWPKLNTYNGAGTQRRCILSCGGPTTGDNVLYELFVSLSGELVYRHTSASGEVLVKTAVSTIKTGQFYSIAVRRSDSGGNQNIEFYIDNALKGIASVTVNGSASALPVPPPVANASAVFSIGRSQKESNSAFWDGFIDEVSVHKVARLYQPYLIGSYYQAALRSPTTKITATNTATSISSYDMGSGVRWWCIERDRDLYVVRESPFGNFGAETRLTTVGGGNSSGVGRPELVYDSASDTLYVFFVSGNRIFKLTANSTDDPATINMPFTSDTGTIIKAVDLVDGGRLADGGSGQREYLLTDSTYVTRTPVKLALTDAASSNLLADGGSGQYATFSTGTPNTPFIAFQTIPGFGFGIVIGPIDSENSGYLLYRVDGGANTLLSTPVLLPNGRQYFVSISSRTYGAGYFAEALTAAKQKSGVYSSILVDLFAEIQTDPLGLILRYGQNGNGPDFGNLADGGSGQREYLLSDTTYVQRTPVKISTQDPDTNQLADGGSGQAGTATNGSTNRSVDAGKVFYL